MFLLGQGSHERPRLAKQVTFTVTFINESNLLIYLQNVLRVKWMRPPWAEGGVQWTGEKINIFPLYLIRKKRDVVSLHWLRACLCRMTFKINQIKDSFFSWPRLRLQRMTELLFSTFTSWHSLQESQLISLGYFCRLFASLHNKRRHGDMLRLVGCHRWEK